MAGIEFRPNMKKDELLKIAVENGIKADNAMTKPQIISVLMMVGARPADTPENSPQAPAEGDDGAGEDNDTPQDETPAESGAEGQQDADSESGGNPPSPAQTHRNPRRGTTCLSMPGRLFPGGG